MLLFYQNNYGRLYYLRIKISFPLFFFSPQNMFWDAYYGELASSVLSFIAVSHSEHYDSGQCWFSESF